MKYFLLPLMLLPLESFACWEACPEGKDCYFEDHWLSGEELEEMARSKDDGKCLEGDAKTEAFSTGGSFVYTCVNGSLRVEQTNPVAVRRERDKK